jgi:hypothetical protein
MTALYAIVAWTTVHALAYALLKGSGVWADLFSPALALRERSPDPLRSAPRGWIENHAFWDLADDDSAEGQEPEADEDVVFWGVARRTAL